MKTTIRTLGITLLFLVFMNVKAADELDIRINDQQNLIVELQSIEKGAVLSLLDESGEVLFKDRFFNESSYSKILDFESLPDGKYSLKLEKEYSVATSVIRKTGKSITISKGEYSFVYKPILKVDGNKVALYIANPEETFMHVEIFDRYGKSVQYFKSKDLILKRTLDFSRVPAGSYIVTIKTKKNSFTKTLTVG
ncbi:T9SS type A sorting domain-containing protein [Gramella jeungdoensis]|uniref:T9SS type A sorting domain-containing protein n=1 Tax=Gramella jeungdoensis TaxID=708091 RepID=A0ABT0Z4A2_9FLAO|nr:T9SS type A sorting domain-containing protein [Gramella jeungdoensis]MCM8570235.1 T9SS type A sorting domain-containing protein [Gramella jeungdoensis]